MVASPKATYKGSPTNDAHQPRPDDIVILLNWLQTAVTGGGVAVNSLAALNALTPSRDGAAAGVYGSSALPENGIYSGSTTGTPWTKIGDWPISFASLVNVAGTANAITADISAATSPGLVKMRTLVPLDSNTGPVTLAENGGDPVDLLSRAGGALIGGELVAGELAIIAEVGGELRLANSARVLPYKRAYAEGTPYALGDLVENGGSIWYSLQDGNIGNTPSEGAYWASFLQGVSVADGSVTDAKVASPSVLGNRIADKNDVRDWDYSTAYSSSTARGKIQAAADAFASGTNLAPLHAPGNELITINETLVLPPSFVLRGAGRHSDLREYGDTTGGVAHPQRGTLFVTDTSSISAELWTDVDGADANIKPAIVLLGDNCVLEDFTIYTPSALVDAADTGIHIAGARDHVIQRVDIRGGWKKGALYFDATWGRSNTNLTGVAHLPSWADSDFFKLYDFGLTNISVRDSKFYGVHALVVQGSTRSGQGSWPWAPNGFSDCLFDGCKFYNEGDDASRVAGGSLLWIDYKVNEDDTTFAQNMRFNNCRFDSAAKWMMWLDYLKAISFTDCFGETSADWYTAQSQRGVIETTSNTGDVKFRDVALNAQFKPAGGTEIDLREHRYRNEGGKKIYLTDMRPTTRGAVSLPNLWSYGADSGEALNVQSWEENGRIKFVNMNGGVSTFAILEAGQMDWKAAADQKWNAVDVSFQRNSVEFFGQTATQTRLPIAYADTTANSSDATWGGGGEIRRSTSALKYKKNVEPIEPDYSKRVWALESAWYQSNTDLCVGDNPEHGHFGFIADTTADDLPQLTKFGPDGDVEGFAYDRAPVLMHAELIRMGFGADTPDNFVADVLSRLKALEAKT